MTWPTTTTDRTLDHASLAAWVDAAHAAGEHALLAELLGQLPDPDDASLARAEALVVAGRAAEAAALARSAGVTQPDGRAAWPHLVLAAADAASGDASAAAWLLGHAPAAEGPRWARLTRLVTAALDGTGDRRAADRAWLDVVPPSELTAPVPAGRWVEAHVADRDREAPCSSALPAAWRWAEQLSRLTPPLELDARVVVDVAAALEARGDRPGARLLLEAAAARGAEPTILTPALRRVRRGRDGRMTAVVAAVGALVAVAAVLFPPPLAWTLVVAAGAGAAVLHRWWRLEGLTTAESRTVLALRDAFPAYGTGALRRSLRDERTVHVAAATVALAAGVALTATAALDPTTPTATWFVEAWRAAGPTTTLLQALLLLGLPVVAVAVSRRRTVAVGRRRWREARVRGVGPADGAPPACECWRTYGFVGAFAEAYASGHLTDAGDATPVAAATVRRCPATGVPWLAGPVGERGRWLALRGTATSEATTERPTSGGYL